MSGKLSKSQIPMMSRSQLPADVQAAVIRFKNQIRSGAGLTPFGNTNRPGMGSPLPNLAAGCAYYECRVGGAHPGDARPGGVRRLVAEVNIKPRQVLEMYFTDDHYSKGSMKRIL